MNKNPRIRKIYDDLFNVFLQGIPCASMLDIGCGTGIYFDVLAKYSDRIEAIDSSPAMIEIATDYCRKNGLANIHPRKGTAESLEFDDASFDVVIELDLLHHVSDLDRTLHEVHRVLKPAGHFFVFEPNVCNPLMLLAHALPSEERLAMGRNRPKKLTALLEQRFRTVRWEGVCDLITQTTGLKRRMLDVYLKMTRLIGAKKLYPRQAWLGIKSTGVEKRF